jgi:hypothetical protein
MTRLGDVHDTRDVDEEEDSVATKTLDEYGPGEFFRIFVAHLATALSGGSVLSKMLNWNRNVPKVASSLEYGLGLWVHVYSLVSSLRNKMFVYMLV